MKINIMSLEDAKDFIPQVPTYAIRIFDSNGMGEELMKIPLQKSPLFTIKQYVFDDIPFHAYQTQQEFDMIYRRIQTGSARCISHCLATQLITDFFYMGKTKSHY